MLFLFLLLTYLVFNDLEHGLLETIVRTIDTLECLREPRSQEILKVLGSWKKERGEKIPAFKTVNLFKKKKRCSENSNGKD